MTALGNPSDPVIAAPVAQNGAGTPVRSGLDAVVDELTANYRQYFPEMPVRPTLGAVTTVRRRLSDIARVELVSARERVTVYVKTHKKADAPLERVREKARREFDTLADLHRKFQSVPRCGVVRPIAFFAEHVTVVTEAGQGENLHGLIKRGARLWSAPFETARLEEYCRASGVWLRRFQELTASSSHEELPLEAILSEIARNLDACVDMGLARAEASGLLAVVRGAADALAGRRFPVVGIHPDYQPDNVLVGDDRITVLDFTSFHHATALSDVARFLAVLAMLPKNPLYRPATTTRLMRAFLHGYGHTAPELGTGLTLYLARYVVMAATDARAWRYPGPIKHLAARRTMRQLARWARAAAGRRPEA